MSGLYSSKVGHTHNRTRVIHYNIMQRYCIEILHNKKLQEIKLNISENGLYSKSFDDQRWSYNNRKSTKDYSLWEGERAREREDIEGRQSRASHEANTTIEGALEITCRRRRSKDLEGPAHVCRMRTRGVGDNPHHRAKSGAARRRTIAASFACAGACRTCISGNCLAIIFFSQNKTTCDTRNIQA